VWLGVSVENQQWADIRIRALFGTPAAVRFLSCEPLLGPVDIARAGWLAPDEFARPGIGWVIVGGESGPGARPMHSAWVRELREQCTAADVPFFMKQWGEWAPIDQPGRSAFDYVTDDDRCQIVDIRGNLRGRPWAGWKVQDGTRDAEPVRRYGKKVAGRELDGHTWDQYPAVPA
jgi:protein gp37